MHTNKVEWETMLKERYIVGGGGGRANTMVMVFKGPAAALLNGLSSAST